MRDEPLVLAVPSFNSERFLGATLKSLNDNGQHVRWWLQDGGSTDRTLEIAKELARPGDTIMSEKDQGQADALNRAMSKMGGEIIGFLNSDDCLATGTAERVLKFFSEHPTADLVYGGVEWIDAAGTITGKHLGAISSLEEILAIYDVWWCDRQWVQPEVFFRRRLFERVGGFNTRYHLAFDYDFWVRCFLQGAKVASIPCVLARFRLHPDQKSTQAERAAAEIRQIVQQHLSDATRVPRSARKRLEAQLSYDLYRNGEPPFYGKVEAFAKALWKHPRWLTLPSVRKRILRSLSVRLTQKNRR